MMIESKPFRRCVKSLALAVMALLAGASVAWADGGQELFEKIKSSVCQVNIGKGSLGSGLIVDAEKGIIATNYHVVASAVELKGEGKVAVVFPADNDDKEYVSDGFFEIQPGKDLALIHIDPTKRKLKALKLAENLPGPGEHGYACGSPLGLPLTFTDGMISAIRSGTQFSHLPMAGPAYKQMHYDMDAEWIQHTVQISPGNSGGPLFNAKGEVIGQNTWVFAPGTGNSLYFAISSLHLKKLMTGASTNIKAFSSLPPVPDYLRHGGGGGPRGPDGDLEKTFAAWKTFNKAMVVFNKKNGEADKRREAVPAPFPGNPNKGRTIRLKKLSAAFKLYATAYKEFAGAVKGLGADRGVNSELVQWLLNEGVMLDRTGAAYAELATSVASDSGTGDFAEVKVMVYKDVLEKFRADYDVHRLNLSRQFGKEFPTVEETERDASTDSSKEAKKSDNGSSEKPKVSESENRFEFRTWTSKSGKFKVVAKFRGVEDGKVKLERKDGTMLRVPLSMLSEADQRFVEAS